MFHIEVCYFHLQRFNLRGSGTWDKVNIKAEQSLEIFGV